MANMIIVNKGVYEENDLQISNDEWQEARRSMTYSEFTLYLYLAGMKNGYNAMPTQKEFEEITGIKKTAYYDAIKRLKEMGYLVQMQDNLSMFYCRPFRSDGGAPKISFSESS